MSSVREIVAEIQRDMRSDLLPEQARKHLTTLAGLHGTVHAELRSAEAAYSHVLLQHLDGSEAANRARIRAQTSPEYARLLEAKHVAESVKVMDRAIRESMRSLSEEMRLAR